MFKARRPPVYSEGRIFEFVPDSMAAWKLERDGQVMAELRRTEGAYLAIANDEQVGGSFVTIEEAVAAVPALRTLNAPGAWRLTTSLPNGVAGFMLDEPAEGVEKVEVNETFWETWTPKKAGGRQIRDQRFLIPWDLLADEVAEIVLLDASTNMPGLVEGGFLITRYGPLCEYSDPELDTDAWIREPDDLQACLELVGMSELLVTKLNFPSQPGSIVRDRTGRATSGAGFSESDVSRILSALYPFRVVWVNGKLWFEGHPAPHGLQRSLSGQPVRLFVQREGWFWRSGVLTDVTLEDSPNASSWFAVVSPDPEVAKQVLVANFTGSSVYGHRWELPGVVLETLESKPYLGFVLDDLETALLYADAFGGVVIAGDDATLVEASENGSVVRAWSWNSERADPPAVANDLPSM
jgi:hypothetical protein